jgi:predicted transcriptional regulator
MSSTTKRLTTLAEAIQPMPEARGPKDEAWHDAQTRQALKEAEAGDFASVAEVEATVRKFVRHG